MSQSGVSNLFYYHGRQCSHHPVEVLLVCITGTVCLLSLNIYDATHSSKDLTKGSGEEVSRLFQTYRNLNYWVQF